MDEEVNADLTMASTEMECDIINQLFELDLDEIIQKIFLNLDLLRITNYK